LDTKPGKNDARRRGLEQANPLFAGCILSAGSQRFGA
jgi:hypothetical protein